jgi:hypothetical protein
MFTYVQFERFILYPVSLAMFVFFSRDGSVIYVIFPLIAISIMIDSQFKRISKLESDIKLLTKKCNIKP